MRVLLVEDDPACAAAVKAYLTRRGVVLDVAADGLSGLSMLREASYDCLVVDALTPGMSGFDLIRTIRAGRSAGRNIPILLQSAYYFDSDREAFAEIGIDAFLSKPYSLERLFETLDGLVGAA